MESSRSIHRARARRLASEDEPSSGEAAVGAPATATPPAAEIGLGGWAVIGRRGGRGSGNGTGTGGRGSGRGGGGAASGGSGTGDAASADGRTGTDKERETTALMSLSSG